MLAQAGGGDISKWHFDVADGSLSLERVTWNNSGLITGGVVTEFRKLRERARRTLRTWGSGDVLQTLLKNDPCSACVMARALGAIGVARVRQFPPFT